MEQNRCPVCQARFRESRWCSRCGADLEALMLLAVSAWRLREAARRALGGGDFERALCFAREAQAVRGTPAGKFLETLCAWWVACGAGSQA